MSIPTIRKDGFTFKLINTPLGHKLMAYVLIDGRLVNAGEQFVDETKTFNENVETFLNTLN